MKFKVLIFGLVFSSFCQDSVTQRKQFNELAILSAVNISKLLEIMSSLEGQDEARQALEKVKIADLISLAPIESFFKCCSDKKNNREVRYKIEKGVVVHDAKNEHGETALIIAASNKNSELVDYLLKQGADPNVKSKDNKTPLIGALECMDLKSVKALFEHGAKAEQATLKHYLNISINRRNIELADFILEQVEDVNFFDAKKELTPLIAACRAFSCFSYGIRGINIPNLAGLVKKLLQKGADPNIVTKDGKNALMEFFCSYRSEHGQDIIMDVINQLLNSEANLNDIHRIDNENPFLELIDFPELLKFLLKKGLDVNIQDDNGNTQLIKLANSIFGTGCYPIGCRAFNAIKFFLNNGSDPNLLNNQGFNALSIILKKFSDNSKEKNNCLREIKNLTPGFFEDSDYHSESYLDDYNRKLERLKKIDLLCLETLKLLLKHGSQFNFDPEKKEMCLKLINGLKNIEWDKETKQMMVDALLNNENIQTYLTYLHQTENAIIKSKGYRNVEEIFKKALLKRESIKADQARGLFTQLSVSE